MYLLPMFLFAVLFTLLITMVIYMAWMLVIAFTIWMVVDAAKQDRFWWVLIVIGIPFIGPAAYFFTEKKHEYAKAPNHHVHESETESQHEQTPKHAKHHHDNKDAVAEDSPKSDVLEAEKN